MLLLMSHQMGAVGADLFPELFQRFSRCALMKFLFRSLRYRLRFIDWRFVVAVVVLGAGVLLILAFY